MRNHQLHKQSGVILLEALIAIVIFSFGVLGLIAMQAAAIKQSNDAHMRATASYLANQIISQTWIDRSNLARYIYQETGDVPASGGACVFTGSPVVSDSNVDRWLGATTKPDTVLGALPNARAQIKVVAKLITVTLCWKAPAEATYHNFTSTALISG